MASVRLIEHSGDGPDALAAGIDAALAAGAVGLIVDLGDAPLDSVLLHLFVVTDKAMIARGGRVTLLCDKDSTIAGLVRAIGLDEHLPVADRLSRAMELAGASLQQA